MRPHGFDDIHWEAALESRTCAVMPNLTIPTTHAPFISDKYPTRNPCHIAERSEVLAARVKCRGVYRYRRGNACSSSHYGLFLFLNSATRQLPLKRDSKRHVAGSGKKIPEPVPFTAQYATPSATRFFRVSVL